jgi:KRAB domain-containing zinc finger protein
MDGVIRKKFLACARSVKLNSSSSRRRRIITTRTVKSNTVNWNGLRVFGCKECDKWYRYRYQLKAHFESVHQEVGFKCTECAKVFSTVDDLKAHLKISHNDINPYQCYFCSKAARNESELTSHMEIHTREKPYKCKRCLKSFRCPYYCKYHIQQKSCLKDHMNILHNDDIKRYQCYFCSKAAKYMSELRSHMRMHTREKPYKCKRKPNLCYSCDQGFTTNSKLDLRLSRADTKENPNVFR